MQNVTAAGLVLLRSNRKTVVRLTLSLRPLLLGRDPSVAWRSLPYITLNTGASVVVTPVPLVSAPVEPCDDVNYVATGASAPVTSTTS